MKEWLFAIYQYATVIIPGGLGLIYLKKKGVRGSGLTWCLTAAFMLYIAAVADVTGMGSLISGLRLGIDYRTINLIPFSQEIDVTGYLLNILMMFPFGLLYPALKRSAGFVETTLCGLGVSFFIEISQLFCWRSTDVDDLICNTLGAALGYLAFVIGSKLFKWKPKDDVRPMALALIMLVGRFLLYDGMGVAGLIYGF